MKFACDWCAHIGDGTLGWKHALMCSISPPQHGWSVATKTFAAWSWRLEEAGSVWIILSPGWFGAHCQWYHYRQPGVRAEHRAGAIQNIQNWLATAVESIYWNLLYHWEMLDCWGMFGAMFGSQQKALTTPNLVWYPRGVEPDVHGAGYLGPPQCRRSGCQILRGIPRRSSSQAFGVSKLASLPVNLLVEGLSNLPVRNFVQDIRTSVLALLLVFASQSRARMRKPRNYIVFAGDTTVRLTCVMPCNHCRYCRVPWVAFVFCQVKAAASSQFQMWTSVVGIASPWSGSSALRYIRARFGWVLPWHSFGISARRVYRNVAQNVGVSQTDGPECLTYLDILLENAPKALRNQLLRRLAAMAPGSTLKVMKNGKARRWRERERERCAVCM